MKRKKEIDRLGFLAPPCPPALSPILLSIPSILQPFPSSALALNPIIKPNTNFAFTPLLYYQYLLIPLKTSGHLEVIWVILRNYFPQ